MQVDRVETHAASVIVNVAQSSPGSAWPLRILDHSGNSHDVNMQPGEAVLYESARLLHARPEPLEGEWFANAFVHFRTVDWESEWVASAEKKDMERCVEGTAKTPKMSRKRVVFGLFSVYFG